jgi:hypothetical protein
MERSAAQEGSPSRITVPDRAHPLSRLVFAEMQRQGITYVDMADKSGISRETLTAWRVRNVPDLTSLEACFGVLRLRLAPIDTEGNIYEPQPETVAWAEAMAPARAAQAVRVEERQRRAAKMLRRQRREAKKRRRLLRRAEERRRLQRAAEEPQRAEERRRRQRQRERERRRAKREAALAPPGAVARSALGRNYGPAMETGQ